MIFTTKRLIIREFDITDLENPKLAMIGYTINPRFWKMGYGTEVTEGLIKFGFKTLNLDTIQATCDVENISSKRVLKKNGFALLEIIENHKMQKGKLRSSFFFGLEKKE